MDPRLGLSVPCKTHSVITAVTLHDINLLPGGSHGVTCSNKKTPEFHISTSAAPKIKVLGHRGRCAVHSPNHRDPGGGRLPKHTPQHITLVRAQAEVSLCPERTAVRARRQKPTRRTRRPAVEHTQRAPGPRCVDTAPGIRRHDAASDTAGSHAHVRPAWPSLAQPAANVAEPPWGRGGGTKHRRAENRGSL